MKRNETKKNKRRGIFGGYVCHLCVANLCTIKIKYITFFRNRHFPCHTLPLFPCSTFPIPSFVFRPEKAYKRSHEFDSVSGIEIERERERENVLNYTWNLQV